MQNDKNKLTYLLELKDTYNDRYQNKPHKPIQPVDAIHALFDYPMNGFPLICGGFKRIGEL